MIDGMIDALTGLDIVKKSVAENILVTLDVKDRLPDGVDDVDSIVSVTATNLGRVSGSTDLTIGTHAHENGIIEFYAGGGTDGESYRLSVVYEVGSEIFEKLLQVTVGQFPDPTVALTPVPADDGPLASALARVRAAIAGDLPWQDIRIVHAAASAAVERFASGAPQDIRDEATIRTAAWLADRQIAVRQETLGPHSISYGPRIGTSPLRGSGAMALLLPWRTFEAVHA